MLHFTVENKVVEVLDITGNDINDCASHIECVMNVVICDTGFTFVSLEAQPVILVAVITFTKVLHPLHNEILGY